MKSSPRKGNEFVDVKVDDWKWETDGLATATDDEQSDEDLIYDKVRHTLLDERSSSRSHSRKSNGVPCRNVLLASSFLCLGLSSSILGPTLPDIVAATNSSSMISLSYLISFNALGYLLGNVILSRLFTRLSPMMFLMFCVLGTVPSTLLIAWSSSLSVVNFHSCVLGIFLGSIHRVFGFRKFEKVEPWEQSSSGETNETSAGNGDSSEMSSDGLNGIPDDLVTSLPSEDRAGIGIFPTATQTAPVITTARQNTSSTATIATTAATSATTSTASTTPSITPSTDASVEAPVANLIGDTLLSVDERKGATGTKMTGAVVGNGVLVDTFSTTQTGQLDESAMWRIVKQQ
ncbi:unnamed protein product, partial [Toxocara canis]|uniref:MFS domain-containing protein n=1 Tax=Toxocara canis TaxID=6265 RepID=A0A183VE61_TOXCA